MHMNQPPLGGSGAFSTAAASKSLPRLEHLARAQLTDVVRATGRIWLKKYVVGVGCGELT